MHTARERWVQLSAWLPLLIAVVWTACWLSPLGLVTALVAAVAARIVLDRIGLEPPAAQRFQDGAQRMRSAAQTTQLSVEITIGVDRILRWGEIAMGGPEVLQYLLRDGAIVDDVSDGWVDVGSGRFRMAMTDARHRVRWVIYDELEKCLYEFDDPEAADIYRRWRGSLPGDGAVLAMLKHGNCTHLMRFRGVWIGVPGFVPPRERVTNVLPSGIELEARLLLPQDLRTMSQPMTLLVHPPYELMVDGRSTGLHVLSLDEVDESERGACVVVRGVRLSSDLTITDGLWHVRYAGRWWSMLSCVHRAYDGPGGYTPYFTELVGVSDDGCITFSACGQGCADGEVIVEEPPPVIEFTVEWQMAPLRLRVCKGMFEVRVPGRTVVEHV